MPLLSTQAQQLATQSQQPLLQDFQLPTQNQAFTQNQALGQGAFQQAQQAIGSGIPEGLSRAQRATLFSRAATLSGQIANQEVANLAQRFGGNVTSPVFQRLATLSRISAGSRTAASLADIGIEESRRNQLLEMQRRQQLLGLSQVGLGFGQLGLAAGQADTQAQLGRGQLQLGQQQLRSQNILGVLGLQAGLTRALISRPRFGIVRPAFERSLEAATLGGLGFSPPIQHRFR